MDDAIHLKVYQKFFAILVSVLPGVNLVLGLSALFLFLFADVMGIEWGWALGIAAILLCVMFTGWIFVGIGIQKWAEEKGTGMLAGICAPFILVDTAFMGWLFVETVIFASSPGGEDEAEALRMVVEVVTSLA
ncbi:MAG: hypothetical protein AB8I08_32105 [Sandaracinaceae bacterium]